MIYGTCLRGGVSNWGTLWEFDPSTNTYTHRATLNNTLGTGPYGSLEEAPNGLLYGITNFRGSNNAGTIFHFNPNTSAITKIHDLVSATTGLYPYSGFTLFSNGIMYAGIRNGGLNSRGTLISLDPSTNTITKIDDFDNFNGYQPYYGSPLEYIASGF